MLSPTPGSTFSGSSVMFHWSAVSSSNYALTVGSKPGTDDIYFSGLLHSQSATVNSVPTDGRTIYVTLYSQVNGTWVRNDYTYTAFK
jgi:hypothetical protein